MFFVSDNAIGLDVDDLSLELVALQADGSEAKRVASSRVVLEPGIITNGLIKDETKLASAIRKLFANAKPKAVKISSVTFGVPHTQFYPALVELPRAETKDLSAAVWQAACQNLPLVADDLLLDYKVIDDNEERSQVLLVGVSRECVLTWQKFLKSVGIEVLNFDVSAYALWRDLVTSESEETVAVIDLGAKKSNVFIFNKQQLNYSYDFEIGAAALTQLIVDKLGVSESEAEAKKIKQGLDKELFAVLDQTLYEMAREIAVAITDYQIKTANVVTSIKLVGGGAKLKGLLSYLAEKLPVVARLGCLKNVKPGDDSIFIEASGLALRSLWPAKYSSEPLISLLKNPNKKESALVNKKSLFDEADELDTDPDLILGNRLSSQKKLLIGVLLLGVLAVGGAYWYRLATKQKRVEELPAAVVFAEVQKFPYKLTVALDQESYIDGFLRGRIVNDQVESGSDFKEVLNVSRRKIAASISSEEEIWPDPLNELIDKSNVNYPITLRWLVINKQEVVKLALATVDLVNVNKVPYEFNSITKDRIEKTDSLSSLYLHGEIAVSVNQKIINDQVVDLSSLSTASSTQMMTTSTDDVASSTLTSVTSSLDLMSADKAVITETETGWLNVRRGAGKNFEVITKIYPGNSFAYKEKQGEWLQIVLADNETGWILAKYAEIK